MDRAELATAWGIDWFDYQNEALDGEKSTDSSELKVCLYFRTGAGKTYTSLALLHQAGMSEALVVAPPKTHAQWELHASKIGMKLRCISHAKYRQKGVKFSRLLPVIVDEFHMLGGQAGTGWDKLRVQARYIQAPLVVLSATPNYNDAERVYCVENVLAPLSSKGGYIAWIYQNCETEENPFGKLPKVLGFLDGKSAREHLAALPHVYHVEDPHAEFTIVDVPYRTNVPGELLTLGLDRRRKRIVASRMEAEASIRRHSMVDEEGQLHNELADTLIRLIEDADGPVLAFCARAQIALAATDTLLLAGYRAGVVTYTPNAKHSAAVLDLFKAGGLDVLFGTATMATGVDGLDQVCNTLILLDDTNDPSLRRQVIGRILPRGGDSDVSKKRVFRLLGS